jgi:hypothetical protein
MKIFLIYNDNSLQDFDVKRKVNFLIDNIKEKKITYEVILYSEQDIESISWLHKKNKVNFKTIKTSCELNFCTSINSIIALNKTNGSKVFSKNNDLCKFGIKETILLKNEESYISQIVNQEITQLKELKLKETLFFVLSEKDINNIPEIVFENKTIILKSGEKITLEPKIKGDVSTYNWIPSIGLSCSDCPKPELIGDQNQTYELSITDKSGCYTIKSNVEIRIEKSCICASNLEPAVMFFDESLNLEKYDKSKSMENEWLWSIAANQTGGYRFDLLTNRSCAKKYVLKVKRHNGVVIYQNVYSINQINKGSAYHDLYPDYFVFQIKLYNEKNYLNDTRNNPFFTIEIIPIDDNDKECIENKYVSPKVSFSSCN